MTSITERWQRVHAQVQEAARAAGRPEGSVRLVAVSKTHGAEAVVEAFRAGAVDFGENRVQELRSKRDNVARLLGAEAAGTIRWHFIGGLQSRKVRELVPVHLVHSIERASQLKELDKAHDPERGPQRALIQVHIGDEDSKGGVEPGDAPAFVEKAMARSGVEVVGLMCIPPWREELDDARRDFERLVEVREACRARLGRADALPELSMGMSHDFTQAIAAGATLVRVGTAIFGERDYGA